MRSSPHQLAPNILDIADKSRVANVSISGTAAVSAALNAAGAAGVFDIVSDIACHIAVAEDPSGVTETNGYPLSANVVIPVYIPKGYKIGVISDGTAGTLKIHQSRTY